MSISTSTDEPQYGAGQFFAEFGVTENGYVRPHVDTIRAAAVAELEQQLGRELTSPSAAEVQYIEALTLWTTTYFETLEALYYSGYYEHAAGLQLDETLALPQFERLPRREATGEVSFVATGADEPPPGSDSDRPYVGGNTEDVTIPARTRVGTAADDDTPPIVFQTTDSARLRAGEPTVERVPIRALGPLDPRAPDRLSDAQIGRGTNVGAGTIVRILDPVRGVVDVTNPLPTGGSGARADGTLYDFTAGRDRESDAAYRRRYENSFALGGTATLDAIAAAVRNAGDGSIVREVYVRENYTEVDERPDGLPQDSVGPLVRFAEDTQPNRDAVHQALLEVKAGGIESYGDIDGQALLHKDTPFERPYPPEGRDITDDTGDTRSGVGFSLVEELPIHISVDIVVTDRFSTLGEQAIVENILEYIGGDMGGERYPGTSIGDDIYADKVHNAVMNVEGVREITSLGVGTGANPTGRENISVAIDRVATTAPATIDVTPTPGDIE